MCSQNNTDTVNRMAEGESTRKPLSTLREQQDHSGDARKVAARRVSSSSTPRPINHHTVSLVP